MVVDNIDKNLDSENFEGGGLASFLKGVANEIDVVAIPLAVYQFMPNVGVVRWDRRVKVEEMF
jgi:hypothetical protein